MDVLIYALLSSEKEPTHLAGILSAMKGIAGADLYMVPAAGLLAVVCDVPSKGVMAEREICISYAGIIDSIARDFDLLPVRFGTVLSSTDGIVAMLEKNASEIQINLLKIAGKCEFGLKIFCDFGNLKEELRLKAAANANQSVSAFQEQKKSVYRDWVNVKLQEHRLEESILSYVDSLVAEITAQIAVLSPVSKFKKKTTDTTLVDAVFLIDKTKKESLVEVVGGLKNQFKDLNFILTGPWPPYSFVEITHSKMYNE